jgi:hypothetical protein
MSHFQLAMHFRLAIINVAANFFVHSFQFTVYHAVTVYSLQV